jgi:hypothetical protein
MVRRSRTVAPARLMTRFSTCPVARGCPVSKPGARPRGDRATMRAGAIGTRRWPPRLRFGRRSRGLVLGGLWLRWLTWRRAFDLDRQLAGGADPMQSDELSLRVGQLGSARTKTRLACATRGGRARRQAARPAPSAVDPAHRDPGKPGSPPEACRVPPHKQASRGRRPSRDSLRRLRTQPAVPKRRKPLAAGHRTRSASRARTPPLGPKARLTASLPMGGVPWATVDAHTRRQAPSAWAAPPRPRGC